MRTDKLVLISIMAWLLSTHQCGPDRIPYRN
jgi:hypothetical protein